MSATDFNEQIINEFRQNGGQVEMFSGALVLLVHHVGAKSGTERISPVLALEDGDRYAIFASKAGAPDNPGWYHNLKANPRTRIEVGTETVDVEAVEVTGTERDALFDRMAELRPQFAEYREKTERVIPVIVLNRA